MAFPTKKTISLLLIACFLAGFTFSSCQDKAQHTTKVSYVETKMDTILEEDNVPSPTFQQLLIVTTPDWNAFQGTLSKYEWDVKGWKKVGESIPIVVGKKGMAWGKGVMDFPQNGGSAKKEGDQRSPAGVFELGTAFGYAKQIEGLKTVYTPISPTTMCIEDRTSSSYNQIIDEAEIPSDWNSTDHMLRDDDLYEWGVFVEHNYDPPVPGGGSCIFLHIWREDNKGTAGCTAMEKSKMREILAWLDSSKNPRLVQVPLPAYEVLSSSLDLP